jgi:hypothetical protein
VGRGRGVSMLRRPELRAREDGAQGRRRALPAARWCGAQEVSRRWLPARLLGCSSLPRGADEGAAVAKAANRVVSTRSIGLFLTYDGFVTVFLPTTVF